MKTDLSILFLNSDPESVLELEKCLYNSGSYRFFHSPNETGAFDILKHENINLIIFEPASLHNYGIALHDHLINHYPEIIRIIVADECESKMFLEAFIQVHFIIPKPVNILFLKTHIERICRVRKILGNESMVRLSTRISSLPSLPDVFYQLMDELQKAEPSINCVSNLIEHDSSITSRIIQLVNSPSSGLGNRVNSVNHAIALLGLDMTRTLVMYTGVNTYLHASVHILSTAESINNYSFTLGRIAKAIALIETGDEVMAQDAMIAGILSSIGYMLLLNNPRTQEEIRNILFSSNHTLFQAEQMLTGITHAEIGAYYLGIRGFDTPILEAVAYHHRPSAQPAKEFTALTALHIAHTLAPCLLKSVIPCKRNELDRTYLAQLGLADNISFWQHIADSILAADLSLSTCHYSS